MKTKLFILSAAVAFLLAACAGMGTKEEAGVDNLFFLEGIVQDVSGNEFGLLIKVPELKKTPGSPVSDLAEQVVQKSLLFEGMTTEAGGQRAMVREVRGNAARIMLEKPVSFAPGTVLKLKIPKKTIAVVDFEVIKGNQKEAGRVTLEGLTSALVDSGQFIVLERAKLKAVMNELELSLSGMARETPDKFVGKLMIADLILTGTLADLQHEWDINLRLLNTRTGQAVAAISLRTKLFNPTELRDSGPWNENFEPSRSDPSWFIGYRRLGKPGMQPPAYFEASIDTKNGAEDSKRSMKIDFKVREGMQRVVMAARNNKKRDLSLYNGIEFYVRSDKHLYGSFAALSSMPDNANKMDAWASTFEADPEWQKVRLPFDSMVVGRKWITEGAVSYGAQPGDQVLRLNRIEGLWFFVDNTMNKETEGTLWIDNIRFYRD